MADEFKKPSFFRSVMSGIAGYAKGALAGGLVGVIAGGLIGAIAGVFIPGAGEAIAAAIGLNTGTAIGGAAALAGAAGGAGIGGSILASVGSLAGAVTGVVKSREAATPSAQDVVNVAKISFTQGVAVGHQVGQEEASSKWRDRIAQQRGAQVTPTTQL
jgi:hypothetical protein